MTPPTFYLVLFRFAHRGKRLAPQTVEADLPTTLRKAVSLILEYHDATITAEHVRVLRIDAGGRSDATVLALQAAAKWHEDNDSPVPFWLLDYASADYQGDYMAARADDQRATEARGWAA